MVEPVYDAIRPADLPAPPQAAIEIMRACSQTDVTHRELGKIVNSDPVLCAELLRVVNSPFFGLACEVSNIAHAVSILGLKALRNLVLCISVREALGKQQLQGFDSAEFWEDALRRAVAAKILAKYLASDQDDCFTMGLLQDFGLLLLLYVNRDKVEHWNDLRLSDPDARLKKEYALFASSHEQVILTLGEVWRLPNELTLVLGNHHNYKTVNLAPEYLAKCRLLYCADWLSSVFTSKDDNDILEKVRNKVSAESSLSIEQIDNILSELPVAVRDAAGALGFKVGEQVDFDQIIKHANVKLAEENISYQELTWKLNNALKERDKYAAELNRELTLAQEIQQHLLPPSAVKGVPVFGINKAAKILSGDFYDYFQTAQGLIYFNLADVSGKGITAALLMTKACSLFRCLAKQGISLKNAITILNREICETATRGMFVTLVAGCYDPSNDRVKIVNAGHIPVLIRKLDGTFVELSAQSVPVGILPDTEFKEAGFTLANNVLYAFTDGITEAKLNTGEMLELDGLKTYLNKFADIPAEQRLAKIIDSIADTADVAQDDITMLLLDKNGEC